MTIDTAALLEELRTAVHRDAARRRVRRFAVTAIAALAVLVTGVGIAGTYDDWWTGAEPVFQPNQVQNAMDENEGVIDIDLSKKATVARIDDAALVAVATKSGGFCMSLFLANGRGMGSSCDSTPVRDDGTGSAYRTRADDSHWIAYGRITDAGAAALDLSGVGLGRVPLLRGGFYLLDVPRAKWDALDKRHGDVSILDGGGATIRRACVYVGIAPGSRWAGGGELGEPGGCDEPSPEDYEPELAKAHQVVALTLTRAFGALDAGETIAVWQAPNPLGGTCTFEAPAGTRPQQMGGGQCAGPDEWRGGPLLRVGRESTLHDGSYDNLLAGAVRPGSGVVRVAVVAADGRATDAALGGDVFLAELPPSAKVGKRPGPVPGAPYRVIAYDAAGKEVADAEVPGR